MDINIPSQIVVQTAAQWAVDATVYSAKRILITSNATYGATDQRKFKIADGVQTWSNLDYFPVSGYDDATSSIQTQINGKQASGSYLTSANITGTITNGVTDKAPSEDAVFDALALKASLSGTETLTNKRITNRVVSTPVAAQPAINSDNGDIFTIVGLNVAITSFTTNLTGTPTHGQMMSVEITDNGTARAITWGASFAASGTLALTTTTVINTTLRNLFSWDSVTSKWVIVAVA